ncbi:glycosyltransferase family 4 protein [Dysgonomonas sp. Marseille-P4677]|uniref:glycosyltransferase family 4 protein n=1 Tax=Dysgonomonas sp. Marseille-P4677 TaxID=2364790 RepID=UPI0019117638|nr:glycosyltransferase family 4 protein [Dysgonomonas sp. Marseille-P4677]MBK5719448.1 glycosyltransferase family 4 protein [Dysgonomonas sp. Marseille-P4677]
MIEDTIHICTSSNGGMSSVVNSYVRLFALPKKNYWSSHNGSFIKSLFKTFFICIRILFDNHEIYHLHISHKGSVIRKLFISIFVRLRKKKYVVHLHGGRFKEVISRSKFEMKFIYNLLLHSNAIVCITKDMKNFLAENFHIKKKVFVISNLCETITDIPLDLSSRTEPIRIVYCGAFVPDKGVFDLIEAFESAQFDQSVSLDLFGSGTLPRIGKNNITVHGWIEHSEYLRLLPNYDFLVLPSKYETFGLVYVEAMGIGLPVIGTFGPAIPEIVKNGETGLLVEFGNIKQLTASLEQLVCDKDLRIKMGKNAWKDVRDRFSPQIVLKKLEEMYEKI